MEHACNVRIEDMLRKEYDCHGHIILITVGKVLYLSGELEFKSF